MEKGGVFVLKIFIKRIEQSGLDGLSGLSSKVACWRGTKSCVLLGS